MSISGRHGLTWSQTRTILAKHARCAQVSMLFVQASTDCTFKLPLQSYQAFSVTK